MSGNELTESRINEYMRRIMISRMRILSANGFYGLLLMHMRFALDGSVGTAATDGDRIYFAPAFLDELSDRELDFILMHEIMHVVLRHVARTGDRDPKLFNMACDIVVNSNILLSSGLNKDSITLDKYGESMHLTPNGKEGHEFTAEEVYEMLMQSAAASGRLSELRLTDDHSRWGTVRAEGADAEWALRMQDAYAAAGRRAGSIPAGIERIIREITHPRIDWKAVLNDFVQEEITDYSFFPPDRRYQDSPLMLPDFNDTESVVRNILFMIDTSASMSDEEVSEAYGEIESAIMQFNGRLEGLLGFFDAEVVPPEPFCSEKDFRMIRPSGGGGTSFKAVFDYVGTEMQDADIASIIILTDGYAEFPDESVSGGIPVLWMINNEDIDPPWGRVARL